MHKPTAIVCGAAAEVTLRAAGLWLLHTLRQGTCPHIQVSSWHIQQAATVGPRAADALVAYIVSN